VGEIAALVPAVGAGVTAPGAPATVAARLPAPDAQAGGLVGELGLAGGGGALLGATA